MNVSLTPELEALVNEKVASGQYACADDVIRAGLRLLGEQDDDQQLRLEELRREIAVGLKQLDEGQSTALDDEVLQGIKTRGRARLAQRWFEL
jgi:antitoxin ParD1/3/4